VELAGVEEALLESEEDEAELSLVDLAAVSVFESEDDLESLEDDEEELSLLELLLFSTGGLGRP